MLVAVASVLSQAGLQLHIVTGDDSPRIRPRDYWTSYSTMIRFSTQPTKSVPYPL